MKEIKDIVQRNGTLLASIHITGSEMAYALIKDVCLPVITVEDMDNLETKIRENNALEQHLVLTYFLGENSVLTDR